MSTFSKLLWFSFILLMTNFTAFLNVSCPHVTKWFRFFSYFEFYETNGFVNYDIFLKNVSVIYAMNMNYCLPKQLPVAFEKRKRLKI